MQLRNLLETKGFYRVPLKKLKSGHYCFQVQINKNSGVFILDSGASTSCIGFESIDYFQLNNEESDVTAAGAGAVNMKTEVARNNHIIIGLWSTKKVDFVLFDLSHVNEALRQVEEGPVHGIIGADFLKDARAVIDYGRNCLYVK
ncbi:MULTISPECIES: retropepsin-like aspartic protease [Altibacter]|uniref:retropepsin-like aspartic protease n=1 Tax=Altibacter TaxID=1535231 RepID=UPI0005570366|nr:MULTISPECIES: retropepsin-like aspartic protease [Altibacter]MCW9038273.1 retroviral-like aspartic protease family protein [Altibacter sp.]